MKLIKNCKYRYIVVKQIHLLSPGDLFNVDHSGSSHIMIKSNLLIGNHFIFSLRNQLHYSFGFQ